MHVYIVRFRGKPHKDEKPNNTLITIHMYGMRMCIQRIEAVFWFLCTCACTHRIDKWLLSCFLVFHIFYDFSKLDYILL